MRSVQVYMWRSDVLLAALLLCPALGAQALSPARDPGYAPADKTEKPLYVDPPAGQDQPTPWSCTPDTILEQRFCVFDAHIDATTPSPSLSQENVDAARVVASWLCNKVSRLPSEAEPDAALVTYCHQRMQKETRACGCNDTQPLLDAQKRFTPQSDVCYKHLQSVVFEIKELADHWWSCCDCLVAHRCAPSLQACAQELSAGHPSSAKPACLQSTCRDECKLASDLMSLQPATEEPRPGEEVPRDRFFHDGILRL